MPPKRKGKERLAQEVLRTHTAAYSISVNNPERWPFLCWRFLRLCQRPNGAFEPEMYFKTKQDSGHFLFGAFGGYANDRMVHLSPKCTLKQHRTLANFVFSLFRSQMHLLGVKLDPFRTLKVQWGHPVVSTAGG